MKIIYLFVLMAVLPLAAQPPRNFYPWWDSPVARDLNLTADQQEQIRQIVREYRSKLIDLRAASEKAEAELEDQFNEQNADPQRSAEAIDRLASARSELTRSFSQMSLRLRAVLSIEQWRELQRRNPKVRRPDMRPGEMRPGGPRHDRPMQQKPSSGSQAPPQL